MSALVLLGEFIHPVNSIIDGRLYLGNRYAASARDILLGLGVTHVVNAAAEQPNHFLDKFAYYNCNLKDNLTEKIDFEGPLRLLTFLFAGLVAGAAHPFPSPCRRWGNCQRIGNQIPDP